MKLSCVHGAVEIKCQNYFKVVM